MKTGVKDGESFLSSMLPVSRRNSNLNTSRNLDEELDEETTERQTMEYGKYMTILRGRTLLAGL